MHARRLKRRDRKFELIELRDFSKHEASDLTKRLRENIDVQDNAPDLSLSSVERERLANLAPRVAYVIVPNAAPL